jgi:hypothetical protein
MRRGSFCAAVEWRSSSAVCAGSRVGVGVCNDGVLGLLCNQMSLETRGVGQLCGRIFRVVFAVMCDRCVEDPYWAGVPLCILAVFRA